METLSGIKRRVIGSCQLILDFVWPAKNLVRMRRQHRRKPNNSAGLPREFSFEPAHLPGRNLLPAAPAIKAARAEYSRHDACPLLGCDCTRQANSRLLGGGLEPAFRVLFSMALSQGNAIRVESGGKERKQNCSQL
jgi:hypothetical protein